MHAISKSVLRLPAAKLILVSLLWVALAPSLGCVSSHDATLRGGHPEPEPKAGPAVPESPGLLFQVDPEAAILTIDYYALGPVSGLRAQGGVVRLAAGVHRVSLSLAGHEAWRAELDLHDKVETIRVTLTRTP